MEREFTSLNVHLYSISDCNESTASLSVRSFMKASSISTLVIFDFNDLFEKSWCCIGVGFFCFLKNYIIFLEKRKRVVKKERVRKLKIG